MLAADGTLSLTKIFRCQCNHLSINNEIKDACLVPCTILTIEGTSTCTLSEVLSISKTTILTVILKLMLLQKQVALKCSVMPYYLVLAVLPYLLKYYLLKTYSWSGQYKFIDCFHRHCEYVLRVETRRRTLKYFGQCRFLSHLLFLKF